MKLPYSINLAIDELNKLPGIGIKTAQRLVFYLLQKKQVSLDTLGDAIKNLKKDLVYCKKCENISETDICSICSDDTRDHSIICVVSDPLDVIALEKPDVYKGVYHVLHGLISPIEGVSPADLTIDKLIERVKKNDIKEVIMATNPTMEGESTAIYIQKKLSDTKIKITRIAQGIPVGGDIEYADEITLKNAIKGRVSY